MIKQAVGVLRSCQGLLCNDAVRTASVINHSHAVQGSSNSLIMPSLGFGQRSMAVRVEVKDGNVDAALKHLARRVKDSGLTEEMRWRQHHLNKSSMRFFLRRDAYNAGVARIIRCGIVGMKHMMCMAFFVLVQRMQTVKVYDSFGLPGHWCGMLN